jgi:hypothetical protein
LTETRAKEATFSGKLRARKSVSSNGDAPALDASKKPIATAIGKFLLVRLIFILAPNLPQAQPRVTIAQRKSCDAQSDI